ncbi:Peptide deformylase 1 [Candidatus Ornithobacterium hominis]|uniref:peptide deformylase n=1 Tax=Candidatus Ornithobacterium hominis TaxID=2497989 RepID=UPI000E5C23F6|nr:peptide deformylase [Candidatus Ornithobacterium hominis]SZD73560.1 Peptide deformylase 1 [Candidatus Ornithobacterium hominis]
MIYDIRAYGDPILREKSQAISSDYPHLDEIIENMFETMYDSNGIGLAAPQVGLPIRLFIIDLSPFKDDQDYADIAEELAEFKKVFINAEIIDEKGGEWKFNEGCLSIPNIREDVSRHAEITIKYLDENFQPHEEEFNDIFARVIQHEYDHIEGILFVDYLSNFKKKLIHKKLEKIKRGNVKVNYKMRFPKA